MGSRAPRLATAALPVVLDVPRNVRVGANSPSLCPTMASVMNTGTCLRPSCTANVCPIMSGMIVERRDQVLMTFLLLPLSFCASTFLSRWSSTNGPFFRLRGIASLTPALVSASSCRACGGGRSAGRSPSPAGTALGLARGVDRVATTGGLALATTVRVVDRVHRHTADGRALALPAHAAGLAPVDVRLLGVADLADGGAAADVDVADLAGGIRSWAYGPSLATSCTLAPAERAILAPPPGRSSIAWIDGTDRDVAQRQGVARLDVGLRAGLDRVALLAGASGRGCSASRRPRSAAARCARCGSGRTRCERPWPARRPCRGDGSRSAGRPACGRRPGAGW